jgi:hypothetical protein
MIGASGWQADARCAGQTEAFYDEKPESVSAAKLLCAECPVRSECLEAGMDEAWGVWGGLTTPERRKLRRDRTHEALRPNLETDTLVSDGHAL